MQDSVSVLVGRGGEAGHIGLIGGGRRRFTFIFVIAAVAVAAVIVFATFDPADGEEDASPETEG